MRWRVFIDRWRLRASKLFAWIGLVPQLHWLRWINRREKRPAAFFLDVGAAGGIAPKWRYAARLGLTRLGGFEPNPPACEALRRRFPGTLFFPYALAGEDGTRPLHVTRFPKCSSCLPPNRAVLDTFPMGREFEVVSTIDIDARAFSSLLAEGKVEPPDFLKIDVQGFEYEVLRGFGPALGDLIGIELESHTKPFYIGQKTVVEMVEFLGEHGFVLRRFTPQGPFQGECVEANLYFSKRPADLSGEQRRKLLLWEIVSYVPEATLFGYPGWLPVE